METQDISFLQSVVNEYVQATGRIGAGKHAHMLLDEIAKEINDKDRLLDLRDDEYYQWWLRGLIPDEREV